MRQGAVRDAIKTLEDALHVLGRNAHALVLHAQHDALLVRRFQLHAHVDAVAGILDGVVEHVKHGRAQIVGIAAHQQAVVAGCLLIAQRLRRQVMTGAGRVHAVAHQLAKIHFALVATRSLVARAPGAQHLLDRLRQPVGIAQHQAVKFLLLCFRNVPPLQRLQMQPDRGHGRFQLMGDGIDETVVPLAAPQLAHQKNGVDHHPRDDQRKEDDAEEQQHALAPVQDDPADVERDRQRNQADPQAEEKHDRSAAARNAHQGSLRHDSTASECQFTA